MYKLIAADVLSAVSPETIDVSTAGPIGDMGTSGLRKEQSYWTEVMTLKFAEGVARHFESVRATTGKNTIVVGGDPRKGNQQRIEWIIGVLIGHGFDVITVGEPGGDNLGMASTPALSAIILKEKALGGFLVTASHNPASDAGIKINGIDGGGVLDDAAKAITRLQNQVTTVTRVPFTFARAAEFGACRIIDPRVAYVEQLQSLIDFDYLRSALASRPDFKIAIDAKGGAGGPFVTYILKEVLGVPDERLVLRGDEADPNLGGDGVHPEPAIQYMGDFIAQVQALGVQIGAGFDGDADRRLVVGAGSDFPAVLSSADEFAMTALAVAEHPEWFKPGLDGVFFDPVANPSGFARIGRSMVTAPALDSCFSAIDSAYKQRGLNGAQLVVTPTGFKYINGYCCNWGVEESNGAGVFSNPGKGEGISEKDGIFHFLLSLTQVLKSGKSLAQLQTEHWQRFGRDAFARGEISDPKGTASDQKALQAKLDSIQIGQKAAGYTVVAIDRPKFHDPNGKDAPLDMKTIKITLRPGVKGDDDPSQDAQVYARFSGTGTGGYTLRLYIHGKTKSADLFPGIEMRRVQSAIESLLAQDPTLNDKLSGEVRTRRTSDWTFDAEMALQTQILTAQFNALV